VLGIAGDLDQLAVLDVIEERACIGAILGASAFNNTGFADVRRHRNLPHETGDGFQPGAKIGQSYKMPVKLKI
jgi:hypothetical protein